eukprot:12471492-Heterocapsa_arctica.AAC.1
MSRGDRDSPSKSEWLLETILSRLEERGPGEGRRSQSPGDHRTKGRAKAIFPRFMALLRLLLRLWLLLLLGFQSLTELS